MLARHVRAIGGRRAGLTLRITVSSTLRSHTANRPLLEIFVRTSLLADSSGDRRWPHRRPRRGAAVEGQAAGWRPSPPPSPPHLRCHLELLVVPLPVVLVVWVVVVVVAQNLQVIPPCGQRATCIT